VEREQFEKLWSSGSIRPPASVEMASVKMPTVARRADRHEAALELARHNAKEVDA
jgi:hypothetical protein